MEHPDDRARGLMFRDDVPDGTGMLFVFPDDRQHSFWMLNCRVPLDLVWLDAEMQVVHLFEHAPPCPERPCPSYAPPVEARFVIEVAGGRARPAGLVPGARVSVSAMPAAADAGTGSRT